MKSAACRQLMTALRYHAASAMAIAVIAAGPGTSARELIAIEPGEVSVVVVIRRSLRH